MERQTEIYDTAQIKKRTKRARNELVQEVALRPALKQVLTAIWYFIGENEDCWPKQETLAIRCGYSPSSVGALQKKLYELRDLGILQIDNGVWNGARRSSFYTINWDRLATFCDAPPAIPEAISTTEQHSSVLPSNRGIKIPSNRGIKIPSNRGINTTSRNVQRNDNNELKASNVVGGFEEADLKNKTQSQPSGHWAGFIDRAFPIAEQARLAAAAVKAGYLTPGKIDKVRFVALVLQAKTRPDEMIAGFFVTRIERGDWGWLDPKYVTHAVNLLRGDKLELTREELREVRMPRKVVKTC